MRSASAGRYAGWQGDTCHPGKRSTGLIGSLTRLAYAGRNVPHLPPTSSPVPSARQRSSMQRQPDVASFLIGSVLFLVARGG
jgi:hypothetical protein